MAQQSGNSGPVRALMFLTVAVVTGCVALVGLYQLIHSYQVRIDEARKPEDTVMVIVAARDLYQGVTITEEDLYAVDIPPRYLPDGVFLSPEHVVGRIPRERILANEFIRADRLADPESGIGLNAVIPRGMRAISADIADGQALSGFLNPGNYVDVLVTITPEDGKKDPETSTLLQAAFVLGVNSRMNEENTEQATQRRGKHRPSVTLLVRADEAEKVAQAETVGRLQLTLRNDLDVNFAELHGIDVNALRSKLETPKPVRSRAPREPQGSTLRIIRGDKIDETQVAPDGTVRQ